MRWMVAPDKIRLNDSLRREPRFLGLSLFDGEDSQPPGRLAQGGEEGGVDLILRQAGRVGDEALELAERDLAECLE